MKLKKLQIGILTLMMIFMTSSIAFAQGTKPDQPLNSPDIDKLLYTFETKGTDDPTTTDYIASLPDADPGLVLGQITYYALVVTNILAFLAFLASGVFMVISQGNDEELSKAKSMLNYTILAMVVSAAALAIVTGVTQLQFFNP